MIIINDLQMFYYEIDSDLHKLHENLVNGLCDFKIRDSLNSKISDYLYPFTSKNIYGDYDLIMNALSRINNMIYKSIINSEYQNIDVHQLSQYIVNEVIDCSTKLLNYNLKRETKSYMTE